MGTMEPTVRNLKIIKIFNKKLMVKNVPKSIKATSSVILAEEALKRGIKISHINNHQKEMAFLELS